MQVKRRSCAAVKLYGAMKDNGPFRSRAIEEYLGRLHGGAVRRLRSTPLGLARGSVKGYGYGVPLRLDYELEGAARRAVLESVRPGPFGHEHRADRAQLLLWAHDAYNRLPRHVASLDVGAVRADGTLVALGDAEEFFLLADFAEGGEYAEDLARIADGRFDPLDQQRADALCDYLVDIHRTRGPDPGLYQRRVRELLGHGECIFGVVDSYPANYAPVLRRIEERCLAWRWTLKARSHRLRQVHGDFHPWNVLFREGVDFSVLDRSRGEWGEPADDVSCLALNYLFFSLQRSGRLEGALERLWLRFWERYLEASADRELLEVVQPFVAWRGLVMANPLWYPRLDEGLRARLLGFVLNVLGTERFEPRRANGYCGT